MLVSLNHNFLKKDMNFFKISVQSTQGTELQEKEEDKN